MATVKGEVVKKRIKFCLDSGAGETVMAESDMFEDISASGLDELDADEEDGVEHLQMYDPEQSMAQSESFNVEVHAIQHSKTSE